MLTPNQGNSYRLHVVLHLLPQEQSSLRLTSCCQPAMCQLGSVWTSGKITACQRASLATKQGWKAFSNSHHHLWCSETEGTCMAKQDPQKSHTGI